MDVVALVVNVALGELGFQHSMDAHLVEVLRILRGSSLQILRRNLFQQQQSDLDTYYLLHSDGDGAQKFE